MSLTGFLLLYLIAAVAGSLGQALAGYSLGGCLISAIVRFISALLGSWLAQELELPEFLPVNIDGRSFPVAGDSYRFNTEGG